MLIYKKTILLTNGTHHSIELEWVWTHDVNWNLDDTKTRPAETHRLAPQSKIRPAVPELVIRHWACIYILDETQHIPPTSLPPLSHPPQNQLYGLHATSNVIWF
jgi:hypothetical protein